MSLTPDEIAKATASPLGNVEYAWPCIVEALESLGILSDNTELAAAATVGVETYTFMTQEEHGSADYFKRYDGRMGNGPGEGYRYRGRGFIQLTGHSNYRHYGGLLGVDLEGNPDLATEPANAAKILALYFKERAVNRYADKGDWKKTRTLVNGGLNGWEKYERILRKLGAIFPLDTQNNATTIINGGTQ